MHIVADQEHSDYAVLVQDGTGTEICSATTGYVGTVG